MIGSFVFNEVTPSSAITVASAVVVQGSANYLPPGVAGPLDDFEALMITLDILAGSTGGTITVYVQQNLTDGVGDWYDLGAFPAVNAATTATYSMPISMYNNAVAPVAIGKNLSPAITSGTTGSNVNGAFGSRLRLVYKAGTSTTAGATIRCTIIGQRPRAAEYGT